METVSELLAAAVNIHAAAKNASVICDILRHIDQIKDVGDSVSVQIIVLNEFAFVQDNIVQQDHISESRSETVRKSDL